ncbi:N-acetylneuraminate synthase [Methanomethylovorans sp.]|uniref:N-acetylneuraminate synthase n=1 Tax=Methanomethylovorans sp. TaxID=2758717 RepID=UPI003D1252C1
MGVYIIAEAGVNHNGNVKLAHELCDAAKETGVDAIKFQTFKTEKILTKSAGMADYQARNVGQIKTQFEMVKELELGFEDFREIKKHCDSIGLDFLSTPDDVDSLDFLVDDLGVSVIKIGSGEATNIPFLRIIGLKKKPIILSTGMSTLGEIEKAMMELKSSGAGEITLLHCTTNYPCPIDQVNLRAMITLRQAFGARIGYSDHTRGIEVAVGAVALGAEIIEKHFTLDRSMIGPDHIASMSPIEMNNLVASIRSIEKALGTGRKIPTDSEISIKAMVRRSIVASRVIEIGELYAENNITTKRTGGTGIPAELWDYVIGRIAVKRLEVDDVISI